MQKQKKNLKYKKRASFKKSPFRTKNIIASKRLFIGHLSSTVTKAIVSQLSDPVLKLKYKSGIQYYLVIRVKSNNVFCTMFDCVAKKTLCTLSAGKTKVRITKKAVKFGHKIIVQRFLARIRGFLRKKCVLLKLLAPTRIRKSIVMQVTGGLRYTRVIIEIKALRCFNGCRPRKIRRGRVKGLRLFKYTNA